MVDDDVLIDGRNRLKACEMAGVEPRFRQFPWEGDAEGKEAAIRRYIVRENLRRRHMNAGQCAIMEALASPDPGNRWRSDSKIESEVHKGELSRARAIVAGGAEPYSGFSWFLKLAHFLGLGGCLPFACFETRASPSCGGFFNGPPGGFAPVPLERILPVPVIGFLLR
jgi:hypothetical protein